MEADFSCFIFCGCDMSLSRTPESEPIATVLIVVIVMIYLLFVLVVFPPSNRNIAHD